MSSGSITCSPIERTGLSEVIGSWKIIAMSRPRISRISSAESASRSRPSNVMLPLVTRPVLASSRMIASEETDLPQPDSPTMATISPRLTV